MRRIAKSEIKKILGDNATNKQVDIVFTLLDFQNEVLTEKISSEIKKLEQKRDETIKKIESDFKIKSEETFEKILNRTVQDILKKNGIQIKTKVDQVVDSEKEKDLSEFETHTDSYSSQNVFNRY